MKIAKLLSLLALAIGLSHCGTTDSVNGGNQPSLLEVVNILDSAQARFKAAAEETTGDPYKAIELTCGYLMGVPGVKSIYAIDSTYIHITLKSGLVTTFSFEQQDAAGNSIFRGGGERAEVVPLLKDLTDAPLANHTIANKKVLFYAADTKTLPAVEPQLKRSLDRITQSGLGLEVTILRDGQCTYKTIETFKDYGLVIVNTHGTMDEFKTGSHVAFLSATSRTEDHIKSVLNSKLGPGAYDKVVAGELRLGVSINAILTDAEWNENLRHRDTVSVYVTSKYLNGLPAMSNTVIFGNMCYSGWIATSEHLPKKSFINKKGETIVWRGDTTIFYDPIGNAFLNRSPISYYAYTRDDVGLPGTSRGVRDEFAGRMEDSLLKRLVTDKDSTGIANRSAANAEFFDPPDQSLRGQLFFRHYGADDYSYAHCVDSLIDERDGQKYKAVCIGKQTWMAENLRYNAPGSKCYDNASGNCDIYGRMYPHDVLLGGAPPTDKIPSGIKGACPNGWHVPSDGEWTTLFTFLGDKIAADKSLKDTLHWIGPTGGANNGTGFSARPGGMFTDNFNTFGGIGTQAHYWTTSPMGTDRATQRLFDQTNNSSNHPAAYRKDAMSCRCVKD